jgi:TolB-like protein
MRRDTRSHGFIADLPNIRMLPVIDRISEVTLLREALDHSPHDPGAYWATFDITP